MIKTVRNSMQTRTPTPRQQQYMEELFHHGKAIKIDKKFDDKLKLDYFDLELPDSFQEEFPGSVQFRKHSSSPTRVYKTTIEGQDYYVKAFQVPQQQQRNNNTDKDDPLRTLLYEKEVYRYIRFKAVENKELLKYIVPMRWATVDRKTRTAYIFTKDTGGIPLFKIAENSHSLEKYFKDFQHTITAQFVSNIFTQLLYVISLLQNIQIVHNDLHFANILLIKDNRNNKTYKMFGHVFQVENHPYSLMVYDFDIASIVSPSSLNNPFRPATCTKSGRCKDYLYTDLYVWLVHLISSPRTWDFVDSTEKRRFYEVVDRFKSDVKKSKSKGIFDWLFRWYKNSDQYQAMNMIQMKQNLSKSLPNYPPPYFHASCKGFRPDIGLCTHYPKPVDGVRLAEAWHNAQAQPIIPQSIK